MTFFRKSLTTQTNINYFMIRPKPHTATTQGYADGKVHKKYVEHTVEGISFDSAKN